DVCSSDLSPSRCYFGLRYQPRRRLETSNKTRVNDTTGVHEKCSQPHPTPVAGGGLYQTLVRDEQVQETGAGLFPHPAIGVDAVSGTGFYDRLCPGNVFYMG